MPHMPDADLIPSLLAVSDVLGTGWYAADAARVRAGGTAVIVGDGAIGLMGVLAAKQMDVGADSVLECVGTQESMAQAIASARPGGSIGFVGVPHGVELGGQQLFFAQKTLSGGPAPVRRFLRHLIELVMSRKINPGQVFDVEMPRLDVAEGYRAMDERRAVKTLLRL